MLEEDGGVGVGGIALAATRVGDLRRKGCPPGGDVMSGLPLGNGLGASAADASP